MSEMFKSVQRELDQLLKKPALTRSDVQRLVQLRDMLSAI